ncbi:MAG: tetratricopeptide repeat protein [Elusimicrobiota bacterium]|jgi:tetratricopeptide (TPR) repeat protein
MPRIDDPETPGRPQLIERLLPYLVALAAAAAFLPALRCGFVGWDDLQLLAGPPWLGLQPHHLRWMFTHFVMGQYQPLGLLSLAVDHAFWGLAPFGYHLTGLLLHGLNAALFFLLARRLLAAGMEGPFAREELSAAAAFAALVFALHPLRAESVVWISERLGLLCATFYLLALLAHLRRTAAPRKRWLLVSLGAYALSLLAKPFGMTLPFALLLLDVYPLRRLPADPRRWLEPGHRTRLFEKLPFLALALAAATAAFASRPDPALLRSGSGFLERAALASYGAAFYLAKTLLPAGLLPLYDLPSPFDPFELRFVASALAVAAAALALLRWRRRVPGLAAAAVFYLLSLSPVLGFVAIREQLAADRYSYIPCMGWAVLAGGGLLAARRRWGRTALYAAAALALLLAVLGWRQAGIWKDSFTLWGSVLARAPATARAHNNLASALAAQGRLDAAAAHYREALRLSPGRADYGERLATVLYNLGNEALRSGRPGDALPLFEESLTLSTGSAQAQNNLGLALARLGRDAQACLRYEAALRSAPGFAPAEYNWGNSLSSLGRLKEARGHYERALRLDPTLHEARFNLGNTLARGGDFDGAARAYRELLRRAPGYPGAAENLARALLLRAGRP